MSLPSVHVALQTLLRAATLIQQNEEVFYVLLNDRHSNHRTAGSRLWHQAKIEERTNNQKGTTTQRIARAKKIFIKSCKREPYFVRKLNDEELSQSLVSYKARLYKIHDKDYVYVEATDDDIEKNMKSFRLKKTEGSKGHTDPSCKTTQGDTSKDVSPSQYVPSAVISLTAEELVQFLVNTGKFVLDDARKRVCSRFPSSCNLQQIANAPTFPDSTNQTYPLPTPTREVVESSNKRKYDDMQSYRNPETFEPEMMHYDRYFGLKGLGTFESASKFSQEGQTSQNVDVLEPLPAPPSPIATAISTDMREKLSVEVNKFDWDGFQLNLQDNDDLSFGDNSILTPRNDEWNIELSEEIHPLTAYFDNDADTSLKPSSA